MLIPAARCCHSVQGMHRRERIAASAISTLEDAMDEVAKSYLVSNVDGSASFGLSLELCDWVDDYCTSLNIECGPRTLFHIV